LFRPIEPVLVYLLEESQLKGHSQSDQQRSAFLTVLAVSWYLCFVAFSDRFAFAYIKDVEIPTPMESSKVTLTVVQVPLERIKPSPFQPRETSFGDIEALARSIKETGLINPITIRKVGDSFHLVTGERRFRALKKLGVKRIPCVLKTEGLDDFGVLGLLSDESTMTNELALVTAYRENLERSDYDPLEEARFFDNAIHHPERFVGAHGPKKKWTTKELAERLSISPAEIEARLSLLKYPKDVLERIVRLQRRETPTSGELPASWAQDLIGKLNEDQAAKIARQIIKSPDMICQEHYQTWTLDHVRFHIKTAKAPERPLAPKETVRRIKEAGRRVIEEIPEDIRGPMERTIEAAVRAHKEIDSSIKPRIEQEFREHPEHARPLIVAAQGVLSKVPVLECPHCHTKPTRVVWECCKQPFRA